VMVENRDLPLPGQPGYDKSRSRVGAPAGSHGAPSPVVWVRIMTAAEDRLADETAIRRRVEEQRRQEEARRKNDDGLSIPAHVHAEAAASMARLQQRAADPTSGVSQRDVKR